VVGVGHDGSLGKFLDLDHEIKCQDFHVYVLGSMNNGLNLIWYQAPD
jgi:hypothetical protein